MLTLKETAVYTLDLLSLLLLIQVVLPQALGVTSGREIRGWRFAVWVGACALWTVAIFAVSSAYDVSAGHRAQYFWLVAALGGVALWLGWVPPARMTRRDPEKNWATTLGLICGIAAALIIWW